MQDISNRYEIDYIQHERYTSTLLLTAVFKRCLYFQGSIKFIWSFFTVSVGLSQNSPSVCVCVNVCVLPQAYAPVLPSSGDAVLQRAPYKQRIKESRDQLIASSLNETDRIFFTCRWRTVWFQGTEWFVTDILSCATQTSHAIEPLILKRRNVRQICLRRP